MAFDAFIQIDGIPGESSDNEHKDWIEVLSYYHNVEQPVSNTASSAGGATAERVDFGQFFIVKQTDKATPKLLNAACTGKHIKKVILHVCRSGGDKQKYMEIEMEQVLISQFNQSGGGEFPTETVGFAPGTFRQTYIQQKRADGTPGGNVIAGWDLIANKVA
jgi:type VI secretion system secreted protein Hcp